MDGEERLATASRKTAARLDWNDGTVWIREELQGVWSDSPLEGIPRGRICAGHIYWDDRFEHPPSQLGPHPIEPGSIVFMDFNGTDNEAIYCPGPPAKMSWNDGEVWTRMSFE